MTVTTMNVVDILSKLKGITGVMGKIFEYDDTYKRIFKQEVIPNLWCESWKKKYNSRIGGFGRTVIPDIAGTHVNVFLVICQLINILMRNPVE